MTDYYLDGILVTKIELITDKINITFVEHSYKYEQGNILYDMITLENGKIYKIYPSNNIEEWRE